MCGVERFCGVAVSWGVVPFSVAGGCCEMGGCGVVGVTFVASKECGVGIRRELGATFGVVVGVFIGRCSVVVDDDVDDDDDD